MDFGDLIFFRKNDLINNMLEYFFGFTFFWIGIITHKNEDGFFISYGHDKSVSLEKSKSENILYHKHFLFDRAIRNNIYTQKNINTDNNIDFICQFMYDSNLLQNKSVPEKLSIWDFINNSPKIHFKYFSKQIKKL